MANRLLAYRVALELEGRRRGRGHRRSSYRLAEIAPRLLECAARCQIAGEGQVSQLATWTDYELAVQARVSIRQTAELYEEIGLGALVREALDRLAEQGLIRVFRRAASGSYRGFGTTPEGLTAVDVRPWYRRLVAFFDPPRDDAPRPV